MTEKQGGFTFDEASMQAMINRWLTLADQYDASSLRLDMDSTSAEQLAPGLDVASKAQADAAIKSVGAYRTYLQKNREFCITQAQTLQVTLDDYLRQEHQHVRRFDEAGQVEI